MFEKEAEKYAENNAYKYASDYISCQEAYKDGAEFGYNKAKEELEKENAELKAFKQDCIKLTEDNVVMAKQRGETVIQLTKAKEIIKDYLTIVKGSHTTVCGVPEENRTIHVLKLNEKAERFISEVEE